MSRATSPPLVWESKTEPGGPAYPGKVWSWRNLHSYSASVPQFCERLQAMAEGLEHATVEIDVWDEEFTVYVVGLRDLTDEDRAEQAQRDEETRKVELAELERLQKKYAETVGEVTGDAD